jgi:hypothetical protein
MKALILILIVALFIPVSLSSQQKQFVGSLASKDKIIYSFVL